MSRKKLVAWTLVLAAVPAATLGVNCDGEVDVNGDPLPIQPLNLAAALGWRGCVDTDLEFSEFFNQNHTVMAWFMPQYPTAYAGPIVANNGSGTYFIGQGAFRANNGGGIGGATKLLVKIGNATAYYTTPLVPGEWHHLAVVCDGGYYRLYLDGVYMCRDMFEGDLFCDAIPTTGLPSGSSTLRIGMPASGSAQFYGLVDDVGVFNKALTTAEIQNIVAAERLSGSESGLLAGYVFETTKPDGNPLPPKLSRTYSMANEGAPGLVPSFKVVVSTGRDNSVDSLFLPDPVQQAYRRLPFAPGVELLVLWGISTPNSSHNDYANFCWDFVLAPGGASTQFQNGRNTTCGEPVYASADGTVETEWTDEPGQPAPGCTNNGNSIDGQNSIAMIEAPGERGSYLHLQTGSIDAAMNNMGFLWLPFPIIQGDQIGAVGTRCADNCHLHTAVGTDDYGSYVTIPTGFSHYEVSYNQGQTWQYIEFGVPQTGDWVRPLP